MWPTWQVAVVAVVSFVGGAGCLLVAALTAAGKDDGSWPHDD